MLPAPLKQAPTESVTPAGTKAHYLRSMLNDPAIVGTKNEPNQKESDREKFDHLVDTQDEEDKTHVKQDKYDKLVSWLVDSGAEFSDLEIKSYQEDKDVRGVQTRRALPAGKRIVFIPLRCIITDEMARNTTMGSKLESIRDRLTTINHCQVIIFMLSSMTKRDSFFQPYFDILPSDFSSFPIYWSKSEQEWLQGSSLLCEIHERKANIRSDYNTIMRFFPELQGISFAQFLWCRMVVGSRNFSIMVDGEKRTAMVPLADMLNHFRPRETSWTFDDKLKGFTISTLRGISMGSQVMDSYGKKCNSKFLLHYGFAVENNREADGKCPNELCVDLSLPVLDSLNSRKKELVPPRRIFRLTMNPEDAGTREVFTYLKISCATEKDLAKISCDAEIGIGTISKRNTAKAFQLLADAMKKKLKLYATSYDQDLRRLADGSLRPFSNQRNALVVICGEKEICHFYIQLAKVVIPLLQFTPAQRSEHLRECDGRQDDMSRFLVYLHFELMAQERLDANIDGHW